MILLFFFRFMFHHIIIIFFFFFNDTATTEIYTLSLHDALPISHSSRCAARLHPRRVRQRLRTPRSEEHTSELQSHVNLVCRLLLEKKKKNNKKNITLISMKFPKFYNALAYTIAHLLRDRYNFTT